MTLFVVPLFRAVSVHGDLSDMMSYDVLYSSTAVRETKRRSSAVVSERRQRLIGEKKHENMRKHET